MKNKKFETIRRKKDFSLIYSKGKTLSNSYFVLRYLNSKKFKLGLAVSKKCQKSAVKRNKIKRQLRNIFYSLNSLPSINLVVITKSTYKIDNYNEMNQSINKLISKLR